MANATTPIDEALERYRLLAKLVEREYARARANPTDERYFELGILERGSKMETVKARQRIDETFGDLTALINHLTILGMAAAFENYARTRIATAIGEARKTLREKFKQSPLAGRDRLVRETDEFQGLNEITKLISADLSVEMLQLLEKIRENRNRFAHGADFRKPPTILEDDAQKALNQAAALLKPV